MVEWNAVEKADQMDLNLICLFLWLIGITVPIFPHFLMGGESVSLHALPLWYYIRCLLKQSMQKLLMADWLFNADHAHLSIFLDQKMT